jgi:hypothetical protein
MQRQFRERRASADRDPFAVAPHVGKSNRDVRDSDAEQQAIKLNR